MVETMEEHGFDNPTIEMAVYIDEAFESRAGRVPVDTAVEYLSGAFEMAELNYEINFDLPAQSLPAVNGVCDEPFQTWNTRASNGNLPFTAKDSNVLLLDRVGGGCANKPTADLNICTAGVKYLDTFREYELSGHDGFSACVGALLHEVGHNLGFTHKPHGGWAFNADGRWHRTPTVGSNDVDNHCGEPIENRENRNSHKYFFYHWCAVSNFEIVGEGYPSPPSTYPPTLNGETVVHADYFTTPPDALSMVEFDYTSPEGGVGEVSSRYKVLNLGNYDVEATVTVSTSTDQSASQTIPIPAGGESIEKSETFSTGSVTSPTDVQVCTDITDARLL